MRGGLFLCGVLVVGLICFITYASLYSGLCGQMVELPHRKPSSTDTTIEPMDLQHSSAIRPPLPFSGVPPLSPVVITLTTIPERLQNPYFRRVLTRLLQQRPQKIFLQIPHVYQRTGEVYVIPPWLQAWADTPHSPVVLCRVLDRGPITKLWGIWMHVSPETPVLYLDDDLLYRTFLLSELFEAWQKEPDSLWCFKVHQDTHWVQAGWNFWLPEGYAGCMTSAKNLARLDSLQQPAECRAIDDHYLGWAFDRLGIPVRPLNLAYPWEHVLELEAHPHWYELKTGTDRTQLQAQCKISLERHTFLPPIKKK